jgi:cell wall-associated NlpC family hydrolase
MGKILKSAASLLTGVALAVSVSATAELPASAATTCDASFNHYYTIRPGSRGADARAVECLLRNAGFPATVNGSYSAWDGRQMGRFRHSAGMTAMAPAGPRAWAALLSRGSAPSLHAGSRGADVLRLQRSLRSLGWRGVHLTGRYDAGTVNAVKTVQRWRNQRATGTSTVSLWRGLQTGRIATAPAVTRAVKAAAARRAAARTTTRGAKALAFAKKQLGDRYVYGATGPNAWDCSGLTGGSWRAAGVRIPRTSQAQFRFGRKVSKASLRPGDLVFFYPGITHVAIYAGNGKVIHASRAGKPVSYLPMKYMPYKGARRPG